MESTEPVTALGSLEEKVEDDRTEKDELVGYHLSFSSVFETKVPGYVHLPCQVLQSRTKHYLHKMH